MPSYGNRSLTCWRHDSRTPLLDPARPWGLLPEPFNQSYAFKKIATADDPEAFLNDYEWTASSVSWLEDQWAADTGALPDRLPPEQTLDTLSTANLANYQKVKAAILETLNLSPKAYRRRLHKMEFGLNYHPRLIWRKIRATYLCWL